MRFAACLVASLFLTLPAYAQDETLPDVSEPCAGAAEIVPLANGRMSGLWLPSEAGRCTLERLRMLPLFVQRVRLLEGRLQLSEERTALLRRQVATAVQEAERATAAIENAERLGREGREEARVERALRWLWFGVGVVVVVALEAVALWIWSELGTP